MGGNKTRDGVKLRSIERMMTGLGLELRRGNNHPTLAVYHGPLDDYTRTKNSCPIASSSNFSYQIFPWIKKVLGYDKNQVDQMLRAYA